jgi:signal transduction histidine kinase
MAGLVDEHYDILNAVRTGYFVLLPVILLGSVIGGYALSRKALAPVGRLTERAQSISLASLDQRLPVPNTGDELQSLAEAWNDLLMRLETEVNRSTRLAMDVSHDLRSAMTVILANAELSLRRVRAPEQYRNTMFAIQQESTHVLSMLEDMLLLAQSGEPKKALLRTPVLLNEIVTEVFDASRAGALMKDQQLILACAQDTGAEVWVEGDRALLRRLTSILVDNALKYTPRAGRIVLSLHKRQATAVLSVQDNGIGIPEHLQSLVFDRLFRADSARSRQDTPGSGLGLAIAKWVTDLHGLKIELVSEVDTGSTFSVLFPELCVAPFRNHQATGFAEED